MWLWAIALFLIGLLAINMLSGLAMVVVLLASTPDPEWSRRRRMLTEISEIIPLFICGWTVRLAAATVPPAPLDGTWRAPTRRRLQIAANKTALVNTMHKALTGRAE